MHGSADIFSKYIDIVPLVLQAAEVCEHAAVDRIVSHWRSTLSLHTDQGTAFESRLFKVMWVILQIKKSRNSTRNPKGNGQVERANRTIITMIKAHLSEEQND